jgi:hypothetical protein
MKTYKNLSQLRTETEAPFVHIAEALIAYYKLLCFDQEELDLIENGPEGLMYHLGGDCFIAENEADFEQMLKDNKFGDLPALPEDCGDFEDPLGPYAPDKALLEWNWCVFINNNGGGPLYVFPAEFASRLPECN